MILKVKTMNRRGGWVFYDEVREINHYSASLEKMKNLQCDGRFISDEFDGQRVEEEEEEISKLGKRKLIPSLVVCIFRQERFERREERIMGV